jgi:hypothetical protein
VNFLPGLPLNCNPSDFGLLSSWDYRRESSYLFCTCSGYLLCQLAFNAERITPKLVGIRHGHFLSLCCLGHLGTPFLLVLQLRLAGDLLLADGQLRAGWPGMTPAGRLISAICVVMSQQAKLGWDSR